MIRINTATSLFALAIGLAASIAAGGPGMAADGTPLQPATDKAAATSSQSATVGVRAGEHKAFSRLVVDWTVPVTYAVDQADGRIHVRFDRPAELAAERIVRRPPPGISGISVSRDDGGLPTLSFDADGRVRHFRDGTKVVVDIFRNTGKATAAKATAPETAGKAPSPPPAKAAISEPAEKPVVAKPVAVATQPPVALVPPKQKPPATAGATFHEQSAKPNATAPAPHGQTAITSGTPKSLPAGPATAVVQPATLPTAPAVAGTNPPPTRMIDPHAEPARIFGAPANVELESEKDGLRLTFAFDKPVGAATFRRGGWLWLVFDTPTRVDLDPIAADAAPLIADIAQIGHRDATVLRMRTEPGYNPSIASDGAKWNFFLAPQTLKPDTPLDVSLPPSRDAALSITTATAGSTLVLQDPEIGDVFYVVPVLESAHGIEAAHDFSDLRLLPTAQGVAVTAFSDRIDVRKRADGISVVAIGGLRLTSPADRAKLLEVAAVEGPPDAFFDFRGWQRTGEGSYQTVRRALVERLLSATEEDRNLARLDLARFYFAHGLADRAAGVLAQMVNKAPELERSPSFRALRGATALLMGNTEAAKADLDDRGLDLEPEIEVWRAAVLAEELDLHGAAFGLQRAEQFVSAYPDSLRARFGLMGAWSALAVDDIPMAQFWNEFLSATPLTGSQNERRRLIEGEIAAAEGEAEKALALFDSLVEGRDRYARARAALDRARLMVADERVSPGEGAEMLDRLRYVWRGDELEFDVLRELGELQIAAHDYRAGLLTLKRAVSNFADEPYAPAVTEEMRATFRRLYLDGEADALPVVTAIGLFNEFRELAPAGAEGDEMIRRLADRMIAVDLLDKAADLLAHQVEFRLEGEDKARVGTRLAIVRLLDRKPEEALAALDASRVGGIPVELARERQMVGARAWAEKGDKARALALIAEDRSEDADRLRAEIQWRARDWSGAAVALARLSGPAPAAGAPLTELRARYVLNQAVALALAGDTERLATLRRNFGAAMEGTRLAADFRIIVSADRTARDFDDVMNRVATVDDFDAFMKAYRARLLEPQKVSAADKPAASG